MEGEIEQKGEDTNETLASVTIKHSNANYVTFYAIAGPKRLINLGLLVKTIPAINISILFSFQNGSVAHQGQQLRTKP